MKKTIFLILAAFFLFLANARISSGGFFGMLKEVADNSEAYDNNSDFSARTSAKSSEYEENRSEEDTTDAPGYYDAERHDRSDTSGIY